MSATDNNCNMLSIKQLLSSNDKYLIPMYQRNYAWEETHLKQLIQDVWDSCQYMTGRKYYIGTLVVYTRPKTTFDFCRIYETVDGQQRLTTLNIIMCAIKNEMQIDDVSFDWYERVNITYEFRERSSQTLVALYNYIDEDKLVDKSIKTMYDNVVGTIKSIVGDDNANLRKFVGFLLDSVTITRVTLPNDTDLNHYFEIMNSRGEQLEKHEILKAALMRFSSGNPQKNLLIGRIWDACADMDRYVQLNFSPDLREAIFGNDWNSIEWKNIDDLMQRTASVIDKTEENELSINDILLEKQTTFNTKTDDDSTRFSSVINFPNFLLQVLRVVTEENIPLDDKRLLHTFLDKIKDEQAVDNFISKLLRIRFLFDCFIVKRDFKDDDKNGKLVLYKLKRQKESFSYNLAIDDSDENQRLLMVEAMFHVSLPSQNYKHWLCAALLYLETHNNGSGLALYLENLAKAYMFDRFLVEKKNDDNFYYGLIFKGHGQTSNSNSINISIPNFTEHIDHFIFNYIDYCFWHEDKKKFSDFEFTSRSSVEHFYPQHPMGNFVVLNDQYLHDIGNLCLISASKNSELSNYQPLAKTEHYGKVGYDSIKQKIMMETVKDSRNKVWREEEIKAHHAIIEKLLQDSYNFMGK